MCRRLRGQPGVDAVDDLLIAGAADGAEAAVELSLRHEFRQIAKIRQQVVIAAGGGQPLLHARGAVAGGEFAQFDPGAVGGQIGEAEARSLVGVFLLLDQADGIGQPAAGIDGERG